MALRRMSIEKLIRKHRVRYGKARLPQRVGRFLTRAVKLCCLFAFLALLSATGYVAYRFFIPRYFELKEIVIRDVSGTVAAEIRELARLKPNAGINLLFLRASTVQQAVLKHPRVASATVQKCYPNALIIKVRERVPVAIVSCGRQGSGSLALIDRDGYVLDAVDNFDREQGQLPFITGVNAREIVLGQKIATSAVCQAIDLLGCLRQTNPTLARVASEVRIEPDEYLTLVLSGGVEVRFGPAGIPDRLAAL